MVQKKFMSQYQAALLGLGLLLVFLLYMGLPGPPEQTLDSRLWRGPNVTVLTGLTRGNSRIFYREVLPIQQARR